MIDKIVDGIPIYNSSSPDELALVNAAFSFGYGFIGRNEQNVIEIQHTDFLSPKFGNNAEEPEIKWF